MDSKDLTTTHVCARAILIFFYLVVLVRFGDKRFLSRKTALDAVLGFLLASMMARAVNGSAPLVPTLVGGLVVVMLHRVVSHLCVHCHWLGTLVKGHSNVVIREGTVVEGSLRKESFSEADMLEDLRLNGVASPGEVELAHVERNGEISVIKRK